MKLQYYRYLWLSDCWVDASDKEDDFIERAAEIYKTSKENIRAKLLSGEEVYYDRGMDYVIRSYTAAKKKEQKYIPAKKVRCDCGHYTSEGCVMSTSSGSSCPLCYDRMSL